MEPRNFEALTAEFITNELQLTKVNEQLRQEVENNARAWEAERAVLSSTIDKCQVVMDLQHSEIAKLKDELEKLTKAAGAAALSSSSSAVDNPEETKSKTIEPSPSGSDLAAAAKDEDVRDIASPVGVEHESDTENEQKNPSTRPSFASLHKKDKSELMSEMRMGSVPHMRKFDSFTRIAEEAKRIRAKSGISQEAEKAKETNRFASSTALHLPEGLRRVLKHELGALHLFDDEEESSFSGSDPSDDDTTLDGEEEPGEPAEPAEPGVN